MQQNRQLLAFLGAALLFIGSFLPLVSMPIVGNVNYFANGHGDGVLMVLIAALSAWFAGRQQFRRLVFTGGTAAALLALTMGMLYYRLRELRDAMPRESAGLIGGLANALASSVQIQWGWAVLALGAVTLLAIGVQATREDREATPSASRVREIGLGVGLLAVVLVVAAGVHAAATSSDASTLLGRNRPASLALDDSSSPVDPTPGAGSAPTPPPTWELSRDTSLIDGRPKVVLRRDADEELRLGYRHQKPTLLIRCQDGQTDLFVYTGVPAQSSYGEIDQTTVRIRVDSAQPERQKWGEATSNEAIFAPHAIALARRLASASRLYVEFTPFESGPETIAFSLEGLKDKLGEIAGACHWKL